MRVKLILLISLCPIRLLAARYESPAHAFVVGALSWLFLLAILWVIKRIIRQTKKANNTSQEACGNQIQNEVLKDESFNNSNEIKYNLKDHIEEPQDKAFTHDNSNDSTNGTRVFPKREILKQFQGKDNVTKIISDSGTISYLSQSRSFDDEVNATGASKLNTVEDEKKHVLFLFNSNNDEVGRYYLGKSLQGKAPSELVEVKDNMCFFESWNPETENWVPCVGVISNPLKEIASKAVLFKSNDLIKNNDNESDRKLKESISAQVTEHLGSTIKGEVKTTGHLLLLQQLTNNSLYSFKHPSDQSDLPSFMWNNEGLFMGSDSVLSYTIPFLWIKTLAKKNVEKFNEVIDLLNKEFGVEASETIVVENIVQGIRQYGFSDYNPNFDIRVNEKPLSTLYGDCISLENFILLFGSNVDMNDLLPSQSNNVNIPSASLAMNNLISEMVDDFRKGEIEGN